jgi:hypothetical protein
LGILQTPLALKRVIAGGRTRSGLQLPCDLAGKPAGCALVAAH